MSKLDEYKTTVQRHGDMISGLSQVTEKTPPGYGTYDGSNRVYFKLYRRNPAVSGGYFWTDERLAEYLAKACGERHAELLARAVELSQEDIADKARAAQAEAVETLQTIKVEKAEAAPAQEQKS